MFLRFSRTVKVFFFLKWGILLNMHSVNVNELYSRKKETPEKSKNSLFRFGVESDGMLAI